MDEHVGARRHTAELKVLAVEVGGVEIGEADRGALLDRERARVGGVAVAEEAAAGEELDATPREPVVVGEAEAALAVAHDELALGGAQLVALEVEHVPVRVRRRGCVAEAARIVVGAHRAVGHPHELVGAHRAGRDRAAAADPDRTVADVVGGGGEAELCPRDR